MPRAKLTPALVATLGTVPGQKRSIWWDEHGDAPRGFALRVTDSGERSYYLVKSALGRKLWHRLGNAAALTLDRARKAAQAIQGDLAKNIDPGAVARAARAEAARIRAAEVQAAQEPTVAELVRAYIATRTLAPSTARNYQRTLDRDIAPSRLGPMKARAVVQADVRRCVQAVAKRGKHQADRVLQLVRYAYRWGLTEEVAPHVSMVDRDPTAGMDLVTLKAERQRRRVLVDVKAETDAQAFAEVKRFWSGTERMRPVPRAFVRLLLLLGLRRTEASLATWADIRLDGDTPTWHVPADRRKVRVTERDPDRDALDVPLPPLAVAILRELRELPHAQGIVFPHLHHGTVGESMRKRSGITDLALHDLRRSCSTAIMRIGGPPHVLTDVLGHRQRGLADSDAVYLLGRRKAEHREWLGRWAAKVEELTGSQGAIPEARPKVVRFRRSRGA